ncbi:unnamed protein product, partial [Nesidiocoris tenuis]
MTPRLLRKGDESFNIYMKPVVHRQHAELPYFYITYVNPEGRVSSNKVRRHSCHSLQCNHTGLATMPSHRKSRHHTAPTNHNQPRFSSLAVTTVRPLQRWIIKRPIVTTHLSSTGLNPLWRQPKLEHDRREGGSQCDRARKCRETRPETS